jgi:hypothetical protein
MGGAINKKPKYDDFFTGIDEEKILYLRNNYKIIDIDYLDHAVFRFKIFGDNSLEQSKIDTLNNMLEYYLDHKDRKIYKKTDYLCNMKEKVCICNTHAEDFRKIYDGVNYKPNKKYISWFKKD